MEKTMLYAGFFIVIGLIILNIKSRIRIARLLKQQALPSLALQSAIVDSAKNMIMVIDRDGHALYANPSFYHITGYTEEEIRENSTLDLLHKGACAAKIKAHLQRAYAGETARDEGSLVKKNGDTMEVEVQCFGIRDGQGQVMAVGIILHDISEMKAYRKDMIIKSEIIRSSQDFIVANDFDMNCIFANPGAFQLSGYAPEEVADMIPINTHEPATAKRIYEACELVLKDGIVWHGDSEFIRKDGTRLQIHQHIFPIDNEKHERIGLATVIRDITSLKEAQRDMEKAKELAEAANVAKSQFLSNMSHEIRTPLNAIIGMTSIAKQSNDLTKIYESLRKIELSSTHLLNIVNDILDISKIESGKMELMEENFDFRKMMVDVSGVVNGVAEEKCIHLTRQIDEEIPNTLYGDPTHLSQIILNLLSNAIKFTPHEGTVALQAGLKHRGDTKVTLEISVTDTGIGIPSEHQHKLFGSFEQTDSSITKKFGGTGLGLAISKRLVHMMGGTIGFESESGKGSTFTFTVQVGIGADDADLGIRDAETSATQNTEFPGKCILVVEDNEINREIIQFVLEDANVSVQFAFDGAIAVDLFQQNGDAYDLILMDIQMPNMDGYTATRMIRGSGLPSGAKIPIVAMTANALSEDMKKALDAGMNGYLTKPINPSEVFVTLNRFL